MPIEGSRRNRLSVGGSLNARPMPSHPLLRAATSPVLEVLERRLCLTGSIGGQLYLDVNSDGTFNAGDTTPAALTGQTVFLDLNDNSAFDSGTDTTATSTSNGNFSFANVADGTYSIGEVTPAGFIRTGSTFIAATVSGNSVTGKNLGNFPTVFNASNSSDAYTVRLNSSNNARLEIVETLQFNTITYSILKSTLPSITINALSGDDTLNVDYSNGMGDPVPAGGINFDAGLNATGAGDHVTVTGSTVADNVLMTNLDVASGAGAIALRMCEKVTVIGNGGPDTLTLGASFNTPVFFDGGSGTDAFVYSGTANADTLTVSTGAISDALASHTYSQIEELDLNFGAGSDTATINHTIAAPVTFIDAGDGDDSVTLSNATTMGVTMQGGNGSDSFVVGAGVSAPVSFSGGPNVDRETINGTAGDDILGIDSAGVLRDGNIYSATFNLIEQLTVDAGLGKDTINFNTGTSNLAVTVLGNDGNDSLLIGSGAATAITFDGGAGTNDVTFNDTANDDDITVSSTGVIANDKSLAMSQIQSLVINALGGNDGITVGSVSATAPVTVNGGTGNDTLSIAAVLGGALVFNGGLSSSDHDTLNLNAGTRTFDSDVNLSSANLTLNVGVNATASFNSSQHFEALNVFGLATFTIGTGKTIVTRAVTASGKLDLLDGDLILNYDVFSPLGTWNGTAYTGAAGLLQRGRNGGNWNGSGICSSVATTQTGLGVAEASQALRLSGNATAVWSGQTVDSTTVLIKFTYAGDLDLNGVVNGDDYFKVDAFITSYTGPMCYFSGDATHDGKVNGDDYFYLDATYFAQNGVL